MKSEDRGQGTGDRRREQAASAWSSRWVLVSCLLSLLSVLSPQPSALCQQLLFEEPLEQGAPDVRVGERPQREVPHRPLVAILIDDMGFNRHVGDGLLALPLRLSYSFFPHGPASREQAEQAHRLGRDVLLHQPMQPRNEAVDPGPGALRLGQAPSEVAAVVLANLAALPHVIGVNNHMGSRYTEDRPAMRAFLLVLREQGLFFVDSFTSPRSIGLDEALRLGLPAARRQIFLDNVQRPDRICRQIKALIELASHQGEAIGIGHPHEATLTALDQCGDALRREVEMVGVSALLHRSEATERP